MANMVTSLVKLYEDSLPYADTRTQDWLLVHRTPMYVWALTAAYLVFVWLGPKVMRDRQPFKLQSFMVIYNLGLVALSLYMFVEILLSVWELKYNLLCSEYNEASRKDPRELRMASVMWWYFFSKAIELLDTVLMVLRKKNSQISFLHVFHHASMLNIWWWVMMFIPGGLSWFGSCLNCLVHVIMYSYYGLSVIPALRGKLWWKQYITQFQLIQFCVTLSHTLNSIRIGCDFPPWGQNLLAGYMISMLILFSNFYIHAYIVKRRQKADAASVASSKTNGVHIQNGTAGYDKAPNGQHAANGQNGYATRQRGKKSV